MHEGTVEERMSRHRTKSVLGVQYERVESSTLTSNPISTLAGRSDFLHSGPIEGTDFEKVHLEAMAANYRHCLQLSQNVAASIPQRAGCHGSKEAQLAEIRRWLRGEPLEDGWDLQALCGSNRFAWQQTTDLTKVAEPCENLQQQSPIEYS